MLRSFSKMRGEFLRLEYSNEYPSGFFDPKLNEYEYIPYIPGSNPPFRCDIRSHSISENAYII